MGLFDNIMLALSSLRANKMRALLTMLGIIIGIGSVIAIVTVGDSLTGTISDAMQGMGVSNITVSVTEREDEEEETSGGMPVRMFRMSNPEAEDLMTDEMIAEYREAFGDQIHAISITESLGTATITTDNTDSSLYGSVSGVNNDYCAAKEVEMLYGRFVKDSDEERQLAVVSDYLVETLFGRGVDGVGKGLTLKIGQKSYNFYICGVYAYEMSSMEKSSGSSISTPLYVPMQTAKKLAYANDGYQTFTVMGAADADTTALMENTEAFFASY